MNRIRLPEFPLRGNCMIVVELLDKQSAVSRSEPYADYIKATAQAEEWLRSGCYSGARIVDLVTKDVVLRMAGAR